MKLCTLIKISWGAQYTKFEEPRFYCFFFCSHSQTMGHFRVYYNTLVGVSAQGAIVLDILKKSLKTNF